MASNLRREEIKQQIVDRLFREKNWEVVSSNDDENDGYQLSCKLELTKSMGSDVGVQNVELVNVLVNTLFYDHDASSHKENPPEDKFWIDLRVNLAKMAVDVVTYLDSESLDILEPGKRMYLDGWPSNKFIRTILNVTDAAEIVELLFRNFDDAERQRYQKQG